MDVVTTDALSEASAADATPDAAPDAAADDRAAPSDGATCTDLNGAWTLDSTCSSIGLGGLEGIACIQQTGCAAQVSFSEYTGSGTVTGDMIAFPYQELGVRYQCTGQVRNGSLQVECVRGTSSLRCTFTASRPMVDGATRLCCDLSAQDCEMGRRCAILGLPGNVQTTGCVPTGTLREGAVCTLRDGRVGFDDCGGVTQCSSHALPSGTRACRRPCARDADCGTGNVCLLIPATPTAGLCRQRCTLFGTDCAMGSTCRFEALRRTALAEPTLVPVCSQVGTVPAGRPCALPPDCEAGLACVRSGASSVCRVMCDRAHPCASGACTPLVESDLEGRGYCA